MEIDGVRLETANYLWLQPRDEKSIRAIIINLVTRRLFAPFGYTLFRTCYTASCCIMHIPRETSLTRRIKPPADTPRRHSDSTVDGIELCRISTRWIEVDFGGESALNISILFSFELRSITFLRIPVSQLSHIPLRKFTI